MTPVKVHEGLSKYGMLICADCNAFIPDHATGYPGHQCNQKEKIYEPAEFISKNVVVFKQHLYGCSCDQCFKLSTLSILKNILNQFKNDTRTAQSSQQFDRTG